MEMSKIEQAIIKTLAYFDLISRPLSEDELYSYLYVQKCSSRELQGGLQSLLRNKIVVEKDGYYSLKNQKINSQKQGDKILEQKWKLAQNIASKMLWIPYLRSVLVIHSLANGTARESSDVDFLIITAKNRLFTCRFFMVVNNILLGRQKTKFNQKDKIDLGFYVSEDGLDIKKTRLHENDILTTYFLATAKPLYNFESYQRFVNKNDWLKKFLPNFEIKNSKYSILDNQNKIRKFLEKILSGKLGDFLNLILKKLQIFKIYLEPKAKNPKSNIWVSDQIIELHHESLREEICNNWKKKVKNLNL